MRFGEVFRCMHILVDVAARHRTLAGASSRPLHSNPFDHPIAIASLSEYVERKVSVRVAVD